MLTSVHIRTYLPLVCRVPEIQEQLGQPFKATGPVSATTTFLPLGYSHCQQVSFAGVYPESRCGYYSYLADRNEKYP